MKTQQTTVTHAELLARFTAADAQAIRDLAKQKKISIAKAVAQHERAAPAMHYYAFETCNNTVVPFATLADAQAWIARVVPPQDYYDAAPDARSYADAYTGDGRGTRDGWRTGILADVQEQCGGLGLLHPHLSKRNGCAVRGMLLRLPQFQARAARARRSCTGGHPGPGH
jgi:hypothetical protein